MTQLSQDNGPGRLEGSCQQLISETRLLRPKRCDDQPEKQAESGYFQEPTWSAPSSFLLQPVCTGSPLNVQDSGPREGVHPPSVTGEPVNERFLWGKYGPVWRAERTLGSDGML